MLLGLLPASAWAKETLIWLLRDLPPLTIFEGPKKGQGAVDQLLPMLIEHMPEYDHSIVRVNRARGTQMLQEPSFTCDPTLLWTPERDRFVRFSIPALAAHSNVVVARTQDQASLAPFISNGEVDLEALLSSKTLKLGIVGQRSYSTRADEIIRAAPPEAISRHFGNDAVGSLLQMQQLGRLDLLLAYWPEVRYIREKLTQQHALSHFPIKGLSRYQLTYVGCSDTPQGRAAITHINQLLRTLRIQTLAPLYAQWLEPEEREAYLNDIRALMRSH
ncbi:TIGR02285 family protein [Pseudomonas aegrilactucae]|uniref:TIGR02285 family protein n=1 Tax=Pseudomonas aegrilactucae TaxID=2854028 RepID=UPI0031344B3A